MKKAFAVRSAVVLSMFVAGSAQAAPTNINGYVCSAMYTKQNHAFFGQGYVELHVFSGAKCTGSSLGTYYFMGTGATVGGYVFNETERLQMFERATQAAKDGVRVHLYVESSGGGIFHTTYFAN